MDDAQWAKVNDLFHRALDQPIAERGAFLDRECAGQPALRDEVLSLLDAHARAGRFLESPAGRAADLLSEAAARGQSLVGQTVGQYVILRVLGEGGMGLIYLAEDSRLGRIVALKALPPEFAGDSLRRERLRHEARAAALLSHPGIATVFALEEAGGQMFIASEYVPGETLREELRRGPLTAEQVLDTAIAVTRALTAAHDRGLVHLDLKPENLIRSPGGVKILDFGLAQFRDVSEGRTPRTAEGVMAGTPAYMSPEQIRGDAVDFRSDLFSLGIVLFELADGTHPFPAKDAPATIAKILEADPAARTRAPDADPNPALAAALDDVIRTCLQKDPRLRFDSTHALLATLERAREGLSGSRQAPAGFRSPAQGDAARARWWWQFHEATASLAYFALLVPLWLVHAWVPGRRGLLLFIGALVSALVAGMLRLHLWFALHSYPAEWATQRARTSPWVRLADIMFSAALLAGAALVLTSHSEVAVILVAAAVGVVLAFAILEPVTSKAAFGG